MVSRKVLCARYVSKYYNVSLAKYGLRLLFYRKQLVIERFNLFVDKTPGDISVMEKIELFSPPVDILI